MSAEEIILTDLNKWKYNPLSMLSWFFRRRRDLFYIHIPSNRSRQLELPILILMKWFWLARSLRSISSIQWRLFLVWRFIAECQSNYVNIFSLALFFPPFSHFLSGRERERDDAFAVEKHLSSRQLAGRSTEAMINRSLPVARMFRVESMHLAEGMSFPTSESIRQIN